MKRIKALTICQPYAHLIAIGDKRVENRGWPTHHRGELLIHAGKSRKMLEDDDESHWITQGDPMCFGAIVAVVNVIDMVHIDTLRHSDYDNKHPWLKNHPHCHGQWCWVLELVARLSTPIPCNGKLGLWEYDRQ